MVEPIPDDVLTRIRKLVQLASDLPKSKWRCETTRLTILNGLCKDPATANRFVVFLARKLVHRGTQELKSTSYLPPDVAIVHRQIMIESIAAMESYIQSPKETNKQRLQELLERMVAEQNEYKRVPWTTARIIHDSGLLLVEYAIHCLVDPDNAGYWAYQTARHYAERYDPSYGTGLIPKSALLVRDIADFWTELYGVEPNLTVAAPKQKVMNLHQPPVERCSKKGLVESVSVPLPTETVTFTHHQGQYLAFIHLYWKLHKQGPAELDMVKFFRVTPPSVHGMVVKLEKQGLISKLPGVARSIRVAIPKEKIPELERIEGPPW